MSEILSLAPHLATGVLLGAIFYGGLWLTVRKGITSKRPVLWFLGSMLLRSFIVLAGFYFVSDGHWQSLLACLVGFVVVRLIVTRLTRVDEKPTGLAREAAHAP